MSGKIDPKKFHSGNGATYKDPKTGVVYLLYQNNRQKEKSEYSVFGDNHHSYTFNFGSNDEFNNDKSSPNIFGSVSIGLHKNREEAKNIFDNLVKPVITDIDPKKTMTKEQEEVWNRIGLSTYR